MKKLLLILAIWLSMPASAQKIHFTDTSNVWKQLFVSYPHETLGYDTYHFANDTIIGSNTYRRIRFSYSTCGACTFFREDTVLKKVYIRDVYYDSDVVLMDYNLNVGDTFTLSITSGTIGAIAEVQKYEVTGIDSTSINAVWHKVWRFSGNLVGFSGFPWPYGPIYVIEGIGCINHPTYMLIPKAPVEPPAQTMYCFTNRGTTPALSPAVGHFDNTTSCTYYPHLSADNPQSKYTTMRVHPNPATTHITITAPDKITNVAITNLLGQIIYTKDNNTEQLQIDVSAFPSGIYFIKINGSEVRRFIKQQ